jgi:hypothetical protein
MQTRPQSGSRVESQQSTPQSDNTTSGTPGEGVRALW